tara:strand:- start:40 stop:399 length:360 start_codon:yes stop_codon:yes gene_type:complete
MSTLEVSNLNDGTTTVATTFVTNGSVKAWVQHNAGTAINDSFNYSSVTDVGTGNYRPNYTNNMANNDYAAAGFAGNASTSVCSGNEMNVAYIDTYYRVGSTGSVADVSEAQLIVLGDLA